MQEETIEEVKDIRVSDEKYYTTLSDFLVSQSKTSQNITELMGGGDVYKSTNWPNIIGPELKAS